MVATLGALAARVREHFLDQFRDFVEQQMKACTVGRAEVKLGGVSGMYRTAYCVDFLSNDGQVRLIECAPERHLAFDRLVADHGRLTLEVDALHWDDVVLRHDLAELPTGVVDAWFDRWYGPDDRTTEMIHSLSVTPRLISVDFGTAPVGALLEMIDLLEKAGATRLQIGAGRGSVLN
jgi:hypothetical protein